MDTRTRWAWLAVVCGFIVGGCATGYSDAYQPAGNLTQGGLPLDRAGSPSAPEVHRTAKPGSEQASQALVDSYARRGYALIGTAFFNSGNDEDEANAVKQARKVGADLVVVFNPKYTGTVTSTIPITTPTTTTARIRSTSTAHGLDGTVRVHGTETVTLHGTTTILQPVSVDRQDFGALFFAKRRWPFGAMWRDLNDEERQSLGRNRGAVARVVVDDSPAYAADVVPGDIVVSVDGVPVSNAESMMPLIQSKAGGRVRVEIVRKGRSLTKDVQLAR